MYFTRLYMLIPIIVINIQRNSISTVRDDIFLLIFLPRKPPRIPDDIITASAIMSVLGIDRDAKVKIRLAVCAKNII